MSRHVVPVIGLTALMAIASACADSSKPLAPTLPTTNNPAALPDGSTLKASSPSPQSPAGGTRLADTSLPVLVASNATPTFDSSTPLQYRFELYNETGGLDRSSGLLNSPRWQVTGADLAFDKRYTWRVRAESSGAIGSWSPTAAFQTAEGAFLRGSQVRDPLTTGRTVGQQRGGHFVPGQGWQADTLVDGIDYDIATCIACRMEFDVTNFGSEEGAPYGLDVKWVTMGDANTFGNFGAFRDHPWKMHLEQRADADTGFKLIWRNGSAGGGEPGDHTGKISSSPVTYPHDANHHFILEWDPSGFQVIVDGFLLFQDGFGGNAYAPPNHRVSLGCWPRGETIVGAIWRNFTLTPK